MRPRHSPAGSGRIGMMALMMLGCVAGVALLLLAGTEYRTASGLGAAWLLLALVCPAMMFLMMRHHGPRDQGGASEGEAPRREVQH